MDIFLKALSCVLIALVFCLALHKQGKDIALLLSLFVCAMVLLVAFQYLSPIIDFFDNLQEIGNLDGQMLQILLKSLGICLLAEVTSLLCADAGNAAMGKTVQFFATAIVLFLSLPLFNNLLDIVIGIMEDV